MDYEGHTKGNPFFFKPKVDHEINLSTGEQATIVGRQLCWEIRIGDRRAMVYLDAECRLQAVFSDGSDFPDKQALKGFIAGELDALVISLTRLQ